jgi:hypothetical protein
MATIKSSVFSFVDFNTPPDGCNDGQMPLPQVTDFNIKFQFWAENVETTFEPFAVPVYATNPVLAAKTATRRLCGRLAFPMPLNVFPITISNSGPGLLPLFDPGTYASAQAFLDNLNSHNEFTWRMDADHIYADSCCIPVYDGGITVSGLAGYAFTGLLSLDYVFYYAEIPAVLLEGTVPVGDCYQIAIYDIDPSDEDAEQLALSNYFKRYAPNCFVTKVEYWSERDWKKGSVIDINYSCLVRNSAWLPVYMFAPTNPTEESVYIESNGRRRVRSASIDEEYQLRTDQLTQWLHRKIEGMLLHDYKLFTNQYYGLEAESFSKSGPYQKDWDTDANIATAVATTKLIKNLSYFNSGCCDVPLDCCPVSPITCAEITGLDTTVAVDPLGVITSWKVTINSCTYAAAPVVNQSVEVFWRERYSLGAFTSAGTIIFDTVGNIVSSVPSPFEILTIDDNFDAIELKVVHDCGGEDFTTILYNPCERLVGIMGDTLDESPDWGLNITDLVFSNWPAFGVTKTVTIYYKEHGAPGLPTLMGTFDIVVDPTYLVTMTPDPFYVGSFDPAWERVDIIAEYSDCGRSFTQVFANPLSGCAVTEEINIDSITADSIDLNWPRVLPTPLFGYDWELYEGPVAGVPVQSGNVTGPGGTLFLYIGGLTTGTAYTFRMRTFCAVASYSSWTEVPFSTL